MCTNDEDECLKSNECRKAVNEQHQRVVSMVIGLSTAGMVLPIAFVKDIVGVLGGTTAIQYLSSGWVLATWVAFSISIASGLLYYRCSALWIRRGYQPKTNGNDLSEGCLDASYCISFITFVVGIVLFIGFIYGTCQ